MKKPDSKPRKKATAPAKKVPTHKVRHTKVELAATSGGDGSEDWRLALLGDFLADAKTLFYPLRTLKRLAVEQGATRREAQLGAVPRVMEELLAGVNAMPPSPERQGLKTSLLNYCVSIGILPEGQQAGECLEVASALVADVMAVFLRQFPKKKQVSPDIWKLYSDKSSGFRRRWDELMKQQAGGAPNEMAEAFGKEVLLNAHADLLDKHLSDGGNLIRSGGYRRGVPGFEQYWKEVLEPIGAKMWKAWQCKNWKRFYRSNTAKGAQKDWGWTKGNWRVLAKRAVLLSLSELNTAHVFGEGEWGTTTRPR